MVMVRSRHSTYRPRDSRYIRVVVYIRSSLVVLLLLQLRAPRFYHIHTKKISICFRSGMYIHINLNMNLSWFVLGLESCARAWLVVNDSTAQPILRPNAEKI